MLGSDRPNTGCVARCGGACACVFEPRRGGRVRRASEKRADQGSDKRRRLSEEWAHKLSAEQLARAEAVLKRLIVAGTAPRAPLSPPLAAAVLVVDGDMTEPAARRLLAIKPGQRVPQWIERIRALDGGAAGASAPARPLPPPPPFVDEEGNAVDMDGGLHGGACSTCAATGVCDGTPWAKNFAAEPT